MTTRWCYVKSSRQKPISSEQHKRFIETARALECDEDKERFEEKLKRIATAKRGIVKTRAVISQRC